VDVRGKLGRSEDVADLAGLEIRVDPGLLLRVIVSIPDDLRVVADQVGAARNVHFLGGLWRIEPNPPMELAAGISTKDRWVGDLDDPLHLASNSTNQITPTVERRDVALEGQDSGTLIWIEDIRIEWHPRRVRKAPDPEIAALDLPGDARNELRFLRLHGSQRTPGEPRNVLDGEVEQLLVGEAQRQQWGWVSGQGGELGEDARHHRFDSSNLVMPVDLVEEQDAPEHELIECPGAGVRDGEQLVDRQVARHLGRDFRRHVASSLQDALDLANEPGNVGDLRNSSHLGVACHVVKLVRVERPRYELMELWDPVGDALTHDGGTHPEVVLGREVVLIRDLLRSPNEFSKGRATEDVVGRDLAEAGSWVKLMRLAKGQSQLFHPVIEAHRVV
jgi:hypothetical protein